MICPKDHLGNTILVWSTDHDYIPDFVILPGNGTTLVLEVMMSGSWPCQSRRPLRSEASRPSCSRGGGVRVSGGSRASGVSTDPGTLWKTVAPAGADSNYSGHPDQSRMGMPAPECVRPVPKAMYGESVMGPPASRARSPDQPRSAQISPDQPRSAQISIID